MGEDGLAVAAGAVNELVGGDVVLEENLCLCPPTRANSYAGCKISQITCSCRVITDSEKRELIDYQQIQIFQQIVVNNDERWLQFLFAVPAGIEKNLVSLSSLAYRMLSLYAFPIKRKGGLFMVITYLYVLKKGLAGSLECWMAHQYHLTNRTSW